MNSAIADICERVTVWRLSAQVVGVPPSGLRPVRGRTRGVGGALSEPWMLLKSVRSPSESLGLSREGAEAVLLDGQSKDEEGWISGTLGKEGSRSHEVARKGNPQGYGGVRVVQSLTVAVFTCKGPSGRCRVRLQRRHETSVRSSMSPNGELVAHTAWPVRNTPELQASGGANL